VTRYYYDGEGNRVKKLNPSNQATVYVYGVSGNLVSEYAPETVAGGSTRYVSPDYLGSTRMITGSAGQALARYDYQSFGEEIPAGIGGRSAVAGYVTADNAKQKYTGKERDAETGLDFFLARYYSGAEGRFTSSDPGGVGASCEDPQSWNAYAYTRNNPLLYTDPDGLKYRICDTSGNCINEYSDKDFDKNLNDIAKKGQLIVDGKVIGTYERLNFDDFTPFQQAFYDQMSAQRQATNQMIGSTAAASLVLGATGGLASYAIPSMGLTVLEISPFLPAVPSAIQKLQNIGISLQKANEIIRSPISQKLLDNAQRNLGNINVIQDVGGKLVRITLDPSGYRIISAGYVRAYSVANGIASGRFTPINK